MQEIGEAAAGLGIPFANPSLSLGTLTGAAIPYLRICESGYMDIKNHKVVGLLAE